MTQTDMNESRMSTLEKALLNYQPAKLIVLQYDNALSCLKSTIRAIECNDIEARCNSVNTAIEVISDLYMWLDREKGGTIAENLGTIYSYMIWKLPEVNFRNDKDIAEEVLGLLKQLRSSWVKVDSQVAEQVIQATTESAAARIAVSTKTESQPASVA